MRPASVPIICLAMLLAAGVHAGDAPAFTPGKPFTCDLGEGGTLTMVWCPPGTFSMGSPEEEPGRAKAGETRRQVTLSGGFWIASTETTQALYQAVAGEVRCKFRGPKLPIGAVTYDEAVRFCAALTLRVRAIDPACPVFRLPTEAEWEYACRAGTTTAYACGDQLSAEQASFKSGTPPPQQPAPVGSYPPNAWGIYDMHGNDWEICADWYAEPTAEAATDPVGPTTGTKRVIRGGAFVSLAPSCRSARRTGVPPESKDNDRTIRLVASP